MNMVRPQPYTQRGNGNYNAANNGTDKDGHNSNSQDQQQQRQNPQVIARGRAEEQRVSTPEIRQQIYTPANNAYPQQQAYKVNTPPPIRY